MIFLRFALRIRNLKLGLFYLKISKRNFVKQFWEFVTDEKDKKNSFVSDLLTGGRKKKEEGREYCCYYSVFGCYCLMSFKFPSSDEWFLIGVSFYAPLHLQLHLLLEYSRC